MKETLLKQIAEYTESTGQQPFVSFKNLVPLVDVSGSMSGTPMEVAVALGLMISELNHNVFNNVFISFHTNPSWIELEPGQNILDKTQHAVGSSWGGSTNFLKAVDLIIAKIRGTKGQLNQMKEDEIPDLIVFSDMQFNATDSTFTFRKECGGDTKKMLSMDLTDHTVTGQIREKFRELGMYMEGRPFERTPRIIYWNLKADTVGVPATSTDPGVVMLSGYSPALFKYLFIGGESSVTPLDGLRKMLEDPRYFPIRQTLSDNSEKVFGSADAYCFTTPLIESS